MSACVICGEPAFIGVSGRPSLYCTERCRKSQYDLVCTDCGGRVDGSTPSRSSDEPRCGTCSRQRLIWTREAIVLAVREWADAHGAPPTAMDWKAAGADHPSTTSVQTRFSGSWNAAIAAAGFKPLPQGHRSHPGNRRAAA